MNFYTLLLISFAMSTDAFAAAISKGVRLKNVRFYDALKIGFIFGLIEAVTPIIGWFIGRSASSYVESWDHWIALILLSGLGLHMIYESLKSSDSQADSEPPRQSLPLTIITAIGTSIDAMAVGISLAFVDIRIEIAALFIGLTTMLMVTLGCMLGGVLGHVVGKRAETLGGVILIVVGLLIFYEHMM